MPVSYSHVADIALENANTAGPHVLLGNGFSMAYDASRFAYAKLYETGCSQGLIGRFERSQFEALGTTDFELVLKSMASARRVLETMDDSGLQSAIDHLSNAIESLRNALATLLAGLHPDRPYDIAVEQYASARKFLDQFDKIFTTNYDLLPYWTLRQTEGMEEFTHHGNDDGFRSHPIHPDDEFVWWDHLSPTSQTMHYLHGALHLFQADEGLKKLTWKRTELPLIDQIRAELDRESYPLFVAEGTSVEKLKRIEQSDYLGRSLRSLAGIGGSLIVYGFSFSENDRHIMDAIERSKLKYVAYSMFGPESSQTNTEIRHQIELLQARINERRQQKRRGVGPVRFEAYDASSAAIWQ